MIVLDPRVGSGELEEYFKPYDVDIKIKQLEFGDAFWWGCGVDGPVKVGVERKVLGDLVSSMRSNRLSGFQLKGLLAAYPFAYLLIEGVYRDNGGVIEIYGGKKKRRGMGSRGQQSLWTPMTIQGKPIMYREVDHYLSTLEHICGLSVVFTASRQQTAAWMVSRYKWWEKPWDKHDSWEAIYAPTDHIFPGRRGALDWKPVGPVEVTAAQLPNVSKKAFNFRKHFKSVRLMANAGVRELEKVEGIGRQGAVRIYDWFREGE